MTQIATIRDVNVTKSARHAAFGRENASTRSGTLGVRAASSAPAIHSSSRITESNEGRHSRRGQEQRIPGGDHAGRSARPRRPRTHGDRADRAGAGSSIPDEDYVAAGATISPDAASTWAAAELLLKVKEPIEQEYGYLRDDLVLFTYLHLAAEPELTQALLAPGHGDRLRDGSADLPGAAAAGADERGRRTAGADRRRQRDAEAQRRPGPAGPRRSRHVPGEGRRCIGGGVAGANAVAVSVGLART